MEREIKFRAWDLLMECWSYETQEFDVECGFINTLSNIGRKAQDRFFLQQYTGLKDKNGKEIYEWDIIKILNGHNDQIIKHFLVRFWNGCFTMYDASTGFHTSFGVYQQNALENGVEWDDDNFGELFEVIGNIHENPELIPTKKTN